jgi:predicted homoserine dehydrogenase-like protein
MTEYTSRLLNRQQELGRPVRVAMVGAGQMGSGLAAQIHRIPGLHVSVIADVAIDRAKDAYVRAGVSDVLAADETSDISALIAAVEAGRAVVVSDVEILRELPLDMVIEATGVPDIGARVSLNALRAGQHVGLLNVECDVTVGYLLAELAKQLGQIYTVCRGDEPAEAKRLVDFARDLAFEVVAAGKGKNNPMNPHATPQSLADEAASKHMNPKMLCSFVDGSKAMIEMAALANGTGLALSKRGMHAPETTVPGLSEVYRTVADGGILEKSGVIDYCTGPVAPGVFVVVRTDDPTVHEEMTYLKMGKGPYFAFYRPYHLASIEAPLTIGEAILDGTASLQPVAWNAEVFAGAKRDLQPGERIDGIGGETIYGIAESTSAPDCRSYIPIGLLAGATVTQQIATDQLIRWSDVEIDSTSTIAVIRDFQTQLLDASLAPEDLIDALAKALP